MWFGLLSLPKCSAQRARFSSVGQSKHSSLGSCSALSLEKLLSFLIDYKRKFLVHKLRCGEYKKCQKTPSQIWQVKDETNISFWVSRMLWLGFLSLLLGNHSALYETWFMSCNSTNNKQWTYHCRKLSFLERQDRQMYLSMLQPSQD